LVAHLVGNIQALESLRAAIGGILLLAAPKPEGPANKRDQNASRLKTNEDFFGYWYSLNEALNRASFQFRHRI
jgi:hypothetical protein